MRSHLLLLLLFLPGGITLTTLALLLLTLASTFEFWALLRLFELRLLLLLLRLLVTFTTRVTRATTRVTRWKAFLPPRTPSVLTHGGGLLAWGRFMWMSGAKGD